MVNVEKRKGSDWERKVADIFSERLSGKWKRVPGSGALGTILEVSSLVGDVRGKFNFTNKPIIIEAKTGYGGSKQLTLKKEWLDKVKEEAFQVFGISLLACKFLNARSGVKHFVVMDMEDFLTLMEIAEEVQETLNKLINEKEK